MAIYKDFYWKIWLKYEPKLPAYIWFYAKNICQMQKTRIEVRANIAIFANACKAAWLAIDN